MGPAAPVDARARPGHTSRSGARGGDCPGGGGPPRGLQHTLPPPHPRDQICARSVQPSQERSICCPHPPPRLCCRACCRRLLPSMCCRACCRRLQMRTRSGRWFAATGTARWPPRCAGLSGECGHVPGGREGVVCLVSAGMCREEGSRLSGECGHVPGGREGVVCLVNAGMCREEGREWSEAKCAGLLAAALSPLAWPEAPFHARRDFAFYGNKLFQSSFITAIIGGGAGWMGCSRQPAYCLVAEWGGVQPAGSLACIVSCVGRSSLARLQLLQPSLRAPTGCLAGWRRDPHAPADPGVDVTELSHCSRGLLRGGLHGGPPLDGAHAHAGEGSRERCTTAGGWCARTCGRRSAATDWSDACARERGLSMPRQFVPGACRWVHLARRTCPPWLCCSPLPHGHAGHGVWHGRPALPHLLRRLFHVNPAIQCSCAASALLPQQLLGAGGRGGSPLGLGELLETLPAGDGRA